jgi:hypothetical protein
MKLISDFMSLAKIQQSVRFMSNKSVLITSSSSSLLLMFCLCLATTDAVFAEGRCKDVKITITNNTQDTIKVTKFIYVDTRKNKEHLEALLGANGRDFLDPGKSTVTTRNLAFVRDEPMIFKVTYQHQIGGTNFESPITKVTNTFICNSNDNFTVSLTD